MAADASCTASSERLTRRSFAPRSIASFRGVQRERRRPGRAGPPGRGDLVHSLRGLPLMPGCLSYVGGVGGGEPCSVQVRQRVLRSGLLSMVGFVTVFTLLGASATLAGSFLLF